METRSANPRSTYSVRPWPLLAIVLALSGAGVVASTPAHRSIDTEQSTVTVRVFKSGLFRGFADNHEIRATLKSGVINDTPPIAVRIVIAAANLRVLDPDASAKDREQVQLRMLGPDVLDANRFPEIRFVSNAAEQTSPGRWTVHGELTLHGQTRTLTTSVAEDHGHYRGTLRLKQTEYGITPISIAGGAVKVKDELEIDFDIVTTSRVATES